MYAAAIGHNADVWLCEKRINHQDIETVDK